MYCENLGVDGTPATPVLKKKTQDPRLAPISLAQHCEPPNRAIEHGLHRKTHRLTAFHVQLTIELHPSPKQPLLHHVRGLSCLHPPQRNRYINKSLRDTYVMARISLCNFSTCSALHETYVMSRHLIPQDFRNTGCCAGIGPVEISKKK